MSECERCSLDSLLREVGKDTEAMKLARADERRKIVEHLRQWSKDNKDAFPEQAFAADTWADTFEHGRHNK